jgi:hypothetical protein
MFFKELRGNLKVGDKQGNYPWVEIFSDYQALGGVLGNILKNSFGVMWLQRFT